VGINILETYNSRTLIFARMSEKRRQEIENKRAKLAELRKARQDRQRTDSERRQIPHDVNPSCVLCDLRTDLVFVD
jgi:hypothetical protein